MLLYAELHSVTMINGYPMKTYRVYKKRERGGRYPGQVSRGGRSGFGRENVGDRRVSGRRIPWSKCSFLSRMEFSGPAVAPWGAEAAIGGTPLYLRGPARYPPRD